MNEIEMPTNGGRYVRDPNTGALTRLTDIDAATPPAAADLPPSSPSIPADAAETDPTTEATIEDGAAASKRRS